MTTLEDSIQQWIRPEIQALSAYHVPPAQGLIKLDAMENPYRWPEAMVEQWLQHLRSAELNRYPDPQAQGLKQALREAMAIPAEMELLLGNGSDELIQLLAMALAGPQRAVLAPAPTFVMYQMIATFSGMKYLPVPLTVDFNLDLPAMLEAIERYCPALVFLAYPNNPTGNLFPEPEVRAVIEASPGLVVVDEAYHAFAGHSFLPALAEYDNLLVMRTLSKVGLAGLRLGLLVGRPQWLAQLDKIRLPYNINVLTQLSAEFALRHHEVVTAQARQICDDRASLYQALQALPELQAYPTQANFILFRVATGRGEQLFQGLKQAGILIKHLGGAGGVLQDCLRVTVGRPEENQAFLDALRRLL